MSAKDYLLERRYIMSKINKAKYWVGILYLENLKPNWKDEIGDLLQLPYAYCIHDKDLDEEGNVRKAHIHLIIAFSNTTTYKHAMGIFQLLNDEGKKAINTCQNVINIRHMFNYLIHDTEDSKKKGKYLYNENERVTGNNFDIGAFEQVSKADKMIIQKELAQVIVDKGFTNFIDFYEHAILTYSGSDYYEVLVTYSGFFERLTKGNYQKRLSGM